MSHLLRINTVFVYVRDLKRSRAFYETALGFGKPVIEARFWVEYALPAGDTHFALHLQEAAFFADRDPARQSMKCSFEVRDIHDLVASLKEQGMTVVGEPRKEYGFWLAEIADPDGNRLRLYEKVGK